MKKILLIALCLLLGTGNGFCGLEKMFTSEDVSYDIVLHDNGIILLTGEIIYQDGKPSAGYFLVKTKSGDEFKIFPDGSIQKKVPESWENIIKKDLQAISSDIIHRLNSTTPWQTEWSDGLIPR
jgi:hypothetical protein